MATLLPGGCDRAGEALELTGNVDSMASRNLLAPSGSAYRCPASAVVAGLAPVARNDGVTVWQTLDGITLSLRDGVLVATRGLGYDLMSADVSGDLAVLRGTGGDGYYPHIRSYLDGEDQTVFRAYQCRRTGRERTTLKIDGAAHAAQRIEVQCTSPRDAFTNIYWLGEAGSVLKSRQWISQAVEYMETARVMR